MSDYYILPGQFARLLDGRLGTVQFAGLTLFAPGDWVGVVLEHPTGKNDGEVQGHRYFHCTPGHGIFVRPAALYIIDHLPVRQPPLCRPISGSPPSRSPPRKSPPRRPSVDTAKTQPAKRVITRPRTSTTATSSSASSGASQKKVHNPEAEVLDKHISSASSDASNKKMHDLKAESSKKPTSSASIQLKKDVHEPKGGLSKKTIPSASGKALQKKVADPKAEPLKNPIASAPAKSIRASVSKMNTSPVLSRSAASSGKVSSERTGLSPQVTQNASISSAAMDREVEDLKSKIRLLEKKRTEDAEQLKSLDKIKADRERFEKIIQKLEKKYQPYQQTMTDLKKQLKGAETKIKDLEKETADNELLAETATISREMAKQAAEGLQAEVADLKLQVESLSLDVEIAEEEKLALEDDLTLEEKGGDGSKNTGRENRKLKASLTELREKSQEDETKLKAQVTELQEDVQELEKVKKEYHITKEKLLESEARVEDLKIQVDDAGTQNELIEELTEKNLEMTAKIDELRKANAELEEIKKLDAELEVHSEDEKRKLQQNIEYQQELLDDEHRKVAKQEALIDDLEQTVAQYKGLVGELQTDLNDLRASQQSTAVEANDLSNRSRAIMDLNLKLQASASKTTIKTIDLELRKMDAQESLEHLAIVQHFLPEAYSTDRDSVLSHLRFMRVGFKANLLREFLRERMADQVTETKVFFGCEIVGELTWIWALAAMFESFISSCSVQQFAKVEGALYDLEPVERALNAWIEGVKRDELDQKKCASEVKRTKAVMSHLAEIHIPPSIQYIADRNQTRIILTETYVDNTTTALSNIKTMVSKQLSQLGRDDDASSISRKWDDLIYWARSGKVVASKIIRVVEGLKARSLSMQSEHVAAFELCQDEAEELSLYTQSLGEDLCILLYDESRDEPIQYWELKDTIERTTFSYFGKNPDKTGDKDAFSIACSTLRSKISKMTTHLMELHDLTTDLTQTVEFERGAAPWTLRAKEVMTSLTISAETEDKIRRLQTALHERASQLAIRDKNLDEASVKIELLEARSRDRALVAKRMAELERAVEDAKGRETALEEALARRAAALEALEVERDAGRRAAGADTKPAADPAQTPHPAGAAVLPGPEVIADLAALRHELEGLQAAVRYLRTDSLRARVLEGARFLPWLAVPLLLRSRSRSRSRPSGVPSAARASEARAVLLALLALVRGARVVDLYALAPAGGDKLAWRPEGRLSRAAVWRQREGWEAVVGWWRALFGEGGRRRERGRGRR